MTLSRLVGRIRPPASTMFLLAINLLVVGAIVTRLWRLNDASEFIAEDEAAAPSVTPDWSYAVPNFDTAILHTRPLFAPSRKNPETSAAAPAPPPKPAYRVVGTLMLPGKPPVGLLAKEGGERRRVQAGDDLEGWVVGEVTKSSVLLEHAGERLELKMESGGIGAGAAKVAAQRETQAPVERAAPSNQSRTYRAPPR